MSSLSEKTQPQLTANDFKLLAEVPLIVWAIFSLLLLTLVGALKPGIAALLAVASLIANHHIKQADKLREAKARAAAYANIKGPIIVRSYTPNDDILMIRQRANEWRENLKLSGNKYADIIPVIEFPFTPILYNTLQLSKSWEQYETDFVMTLHSAYIDWYNGKCPKELKDMFANGILPSPQNTTQQ